MNSTGTGTFCVEKLSRFLGKGLVTMEIKSNPLFEQQHLLAAAGTWLSTPPVVDPSETETTPTNSVTRHGQKALARLAAAPQAPRSAIARSQLDRQAKLHGLKTNRLNELVDTKFVTEYNHISADSHKVSSDQHSPSHDSHSRDSIISESAGSKVLDAKTRYSLAPAGLPVGISFIACPFATYTLAFCWSVILKPEISLFLRQSRSALLQVIRDLLTNLEVPMLTDREFVQKEGVIHCACKLIGCRMILIDTQYNALGVFGEESLQEAAIIVTQPVCNRSYKRYSLFTCNSTVKMTYNTALETATKLSQHICPDNA
jgi:hypothetical protein